MMAQKKTREHFFNPYAVEHPWTPVYMGLHIVVELLDFPEYNGRVGLIQEVAFIPKLEVDFRRVKEKVKCAIREETATIIPLSSCARPLLTISKKELNED